MQENFLSEEELNRLPYAATKFIELRNSGCIYVDKTDLIYKLIGFRNAPVFLSRPRRFGKTLLVSTFEALFSRGLKDFQGLKIAKLLTGQEVFNYRVIRLDFSLYADLDADALQENLTTRIANELREIKEIDVLNARKEYVLPGFVLEEIRQVAKDKSLVLLIDEYDSPITHHLHDPKELSKITALLSSFFSAVKSCESLFRFIFITGITRIAHLSLFSVFNNLNEITNDDLYATLTGITEEELHTCFARYLQNAAAVLSLDEEDLAERLRATYDGYQFSLNAVETVYNPWSILSFLRKPYAGFRNYWYESNGGAPALLINYLRNQNEQELFSKLKFYTSADPDDDLVLEDRITAKADLNNIPLDMLLLQTGYYTLRQAGYKVARLVMPNDEVAESLIRLSLDVRNLRPSPGTYIKLGQIGELIDRQDVAAIVRTFNDVLTESISSESRAFADENTIRDIIYSQLPQDGILKSREHTNASGYSDLEIKTARTHLVVEFKRSYRGRSENKALSLALTQLQDRQYGRGTDQRTLLRVAMVISTEKRRISKFQLLIDPLPSQSL